MIFLTEKIDFEGMISALLEEPLDILIFGQKSCMLGPTIFKIFEPN